MGSESSSPAVFRSQLTSTATGPVISCCITIVQVTHPSSTSPEVFSRIGTEAPPATREVTICGSWPIDSGTWIRNVSVPAYSTVKITFESTSTTCCFAFAVVPTVADSLVGRRRVVTGRASFRLASWVGYAVYCQALASRARPTDLPVAPLRSGWIPVNFSSSVITSKASGA